MKYTMYLRNILFSDMKGDLEKLEAELNAIIANMEEKIRKLTDLPTLENQDDLEELTMEINQRCEKIAELGEKLHSLTLQEDSILEKKKITLDEAESLSQKFKYCILNCNTTLNPTTKGDKFSHLKMLISKLNPTIVIVTEVGRPKTNSTDPYDFSDFSIEGYDGPFFSKPAKKIPKYIGKAIHANNSNQKAGTICSCNGTDGDKWHVF